MRTQVFRRFGLVKSENDAELVQWLCGVLDVNSFELRTPASMGLDAGSINNGSPLLRGLFLEAALMAHACRGTAHIAVDDKFQMTVYAAVAIPAGETITFNYTSSLLVSFLRWRFDSTVTSLYYIPVICVNRDGIRIWLVYDAELAILFAWSLQGCKVLFLLTL